MDYEEIARKLSLLRRRDASLRLFGAQSHRYELRPRASPAAVEGFEREHRIELPTDYRDFLLRCGNGGAGPYYGVFPLGFFDGAGDGLQEWYEGDGFAGVLSRSFPHRESWNLPLSRLALPDDLPGSDDEDRWHEERDREYWAPALVDGAFPICHQGCAYRNLLVVSGPERGHIWVDARAGDAGIAPEPDGNGKRRSFSSWYTSWLDAALEGRHSN